MLPTDAIGYRLSIGYRTTNQDKNNNLLLNNTRHDKNNDE